MTIQDKLTLALPDKYNSLFSDKNQPQPSTTQTHDAPTSGPSQQGPIVKFDLSSPKRTLRSSKTSPQPSPSPQPKRKRRFLQPISDSDDEDTAHPPSPKPVKQSRKKIKPTSVTDLTVDPPVETVVTPLAMVTSSDPVCVEPLSAVPLDEPSPAADIPMSEKTPELQAPSYDLLEPITAEVPTETLLQINQESLIQVEEHVAAPVQEISCAANSDAATEALASHTLSIFVNDDDDDDATEVTSVPAKVPASLQGTTSDQTPVPISDSSPVKDSHSPVKDTVSEPPQPSTKSKVCQMQYLQGMFRAKLPSMEARLSNIEATQRSMQSSLVDLSSSVAQLV